MKPIELAGRKVGPGHSCFVIAEAGVNHNGDIQLAKRLVDAAVEAKADAVKFQTFKAERLTSSSAPKAAYQLQTTVRDESQLEMLHRIELTEEMHDELIAYSRKRSILFLSTPFDEISADFLEQLGVPAFKISSGEIANLPFLNHVARKGKPMVVSTGMSTLHEVETAVQVIREAENQALILLHCVSNYPTDPADANLRAMQTMTNAFNLPVGYSDHTPGVEVALAAVALGACILEKHFTLDRNLPGPDHRTSLEPDELRALVRGIRIVEGALGHGRKEPVPSEIDIAKVVRRSLVAAHDLPRGAVLGPDDVAVKRPGRGIPPMALGQVVGRRLTRAVVRDELLEWTALE